MGETGAPAMAPLTVDRGEERWRHFDNSVNAVSFGFVATAILIFMFLVMAVFERFLRPRSSLATQLAAAGGGGLRRRRGGFDVEARGVAGKLDYPSPKGGVCPVRHCRTGQPTGRSFFMVEDWEHAYCDLLFIIIEPGSQQVDPSSWLKNWEHAYPDLILTESGATISHLCPFGLVSSAF